jgi:hypothetical protein
MKQVKVEVEVERKYHEKNREKLKDVLCLLNLNLCFSLYLNLYFGFN